MGGRKVARDEGNAYGGVGACAPESLDINMAATPNNALRIVLVGKTGSGKSATANSILGEKVFDSRIAAHAVTKTCQKACREWKGRELLVVDTPGLFDTKESLDKTCKEISRCVLASCPGPHAIVLVLRLGRYTQEEQQTVALVKTLFGKAAMKYMIILFTRRDELGDQSLSDFLKHADVNLRSLLQECGDRRYAISNSAKTEQAEKEAQVQELLELIDKMVQDNQGAYFSDPIYKDIDQKLRQQEEYLKKVYEDELQNRMKLIEKDYANEPQEEKDKQIKLLLQKHEERMKNIREEAEKNIFQVAFNMIKNMLSRIWHMFW
ncbi:GTPase IMAP family member 7-like isoform 3-T5 [Dama dama]